MFAYMPWLSHESSGNSILVEVEQQVDIWLKQINRMIQNKPYG